MLAISPFSFARLQPVQASGSRAQQAAQARRRGSSSSTNPEPIATSVSTPSSRE